MIKYSESVGAAAIATKRETAASQVIAFAERLAETASKLRGNTADKLYPISREAGTENQKCPEPVSEMPTWFSAVRESLFVIEHALNGIEDAVNRVEV